MRVKRILSMFVLLSFVLLPASSAASEGAGEMHEETIEESLFQGAMAGGGVPSDAWAYIDFTDFNDSTYGPWIYTRVTGTITSFEEVDSARGLSLKTSISPGSGNPYFVTDNSPVRDKMGDGDISVELDLMLTGDQSLNIFVIRSRSGQFSTGGNISGNKLNFGEESADISYNEWHKICYEYNLQEKTNALYLDGVEVYNGAFAGANDGTFDNLRWTFPSPANQGNTFYIDNIKIKSAKAEFPRVSNTSYLNEAGLDATSGDKVQYGVKTIKLDFNNPINKDTVQADNFTLTNDGVPVAGAVAQPSEDGKSVAFTLGEQLLPNTDYKIALGAGLRDEYGNSFDAEETVDFRTSDKKGSIWNIEFDVLLDGAEIDYGEQITETVTVTGDVDDIAEFALYIDGDKYLPKRQESPYIFVFDGLGVGEHSVYARIIGVDGDAQNTTAARFTIVHNEQQVVNVTDFNGSTYGGWAVTNTDRTIRTYVDVDAEHGKSLSVATTPAESGSGSTYLYTNADVSQAMGSGDISIELELMITGGVSLDMFVIRGISALWTTAVTIRNQTLSYGGASAQLNLNQWHTIRFDFNLQKKTSALYFDNSQVYSGDLLGNSDGTISNIRITVTSPVSTEQGPAMYFDNFVVRRSVSYPYVSGVSYYNEDGSNALSGGRVAYDAKTAEVKFNNPMNAATVTKNNIRLYQGDVLIDTAAVSYAESKQAAVITFTKPLRSMTDYRIVVGEGIVDTADNKLSAEAKIEFSTGPKDYDISGWEITRSGVGVFKDQVKSGDKIALKANLVNDTEQVRTGVVILACFDGDRMIGYTLKEYSLGAGQSLAVYTDEVALSFSGELSVEAYAWEGLDKRVPVTSRFYLK